MFSSHNVDLDSMSFRFVSDLGSDTNLNGT